MIRIVDCQFVTSAVNSQGWANHEYADIAFSGRSNVGKSSLLNALTNRKAVAKTSGTPGKTRLINFFEIRFKTATEEDGFLNFVDLPGYGFAKGPIGERKAWQTMMTDYFTNRVQLRGVLALVDIRHKADPKDITMLQMLKSAGVRYLVVATKSDKIPKTKIPAVLKKLKAELDAPEIMAVSSLNKNGLQQIIGWIEDRIL